MGLPSTKGGEKRLGPADHSLRNRCPFLCHPERSRGICSSADLSWKCFPRERSDLRSPFDRATLAFPDGKTSADEGHGFSCAATNAANEGFSP
jgi:hypothetical protein